LQPATAGTLYRDVHDAVDGTEPVQRGLEYCAAVGLIRDIGDDPSHPLPRGVGLLSDRSGRRRGAGSYDDIRSLPKAGQPPR
jgi:hypothetical protein